MTVFEKDLNDHDKIKDIKIKDCRENHYIKKMAYYLIGLTTFGIICFFNLDPVFMMMPVLSAKSCLQYELYQNTTEFTIHPYQI